MDHSTLAGNVYEQDAGGNSTLTRLDAELAFNKETEDWKPVTDSSLTYGDLRLLQEFVMGVEAERYHTTMIGPLPKRKAELGDGEPSPLDHCNCAAGDDAYLACHADWCNFGRVGSLAKNLARRSGAAQEVSPVGSVQKITGPERPRCPVCGSETTCLSCGQEVSPPSPDMGNMGNSDHVREVTEMVAPMHFEVIKYNAMCWKVYLGNSYLGAHNTEQQAANFVRNLEINMRKFVGGDTRELKAALSNLVARLKIVMAWPEPHFSHDLPIEIRAELAEAERILFTQT